MFLLFFLKEKSLSSQRDCGIGVVVYGRHGDKQDRGALYAFECSCIFVGNVFGYLGLVRVFVFFKCLTEFSFMKDNQTKTKNHVC